MTNKGDENRSGSVLEDKIGTFSSTSTVEKNLILPSVFDYPGRIAEPTAWVGHIPFAFWLIDAHRPGLLVELGTHTGNSYSAFAQTIQRLALPTQCYAVDTWRGDEHAGFYTDDIFNEFSSYHDTRYRAFSRLLRSTFDDARQYFKDGSIDLLHIDGLHTYEAVKHDFDTWLPKLSDRAVVLMHDINVRENHFGVWELWAELSKRYPHFAFDHSHGLGVLGVGKNLGPRLNWLFSLPNDDASESDAALTRAFFGRLGGALLDSSALQRIERDVRAAKSEYELANQGVLNELRGLRGERENLAKHFEAAHAELEVLRRERTNALEVIQNLESQKQAADQELGILRDTHQRQAKHIETLEFETRQAKLKLMARRWWLGAVRDRLGVQPRLVKALDLGTTGLLVGQSPFVVRATLTARHPVSRARRRAHFVHYLSLEQAVADLTKLFDADWYRQHNPDIEGSDSRLFFHYLELGWKEERNPSPIFDTKFYLEKYPDVAQSGQSPLVHYVRSGASTGHWPHPLFDPEFYRTEVEAAGQVMDGNPLAHYLRNEGRGFEGRSTHALFDTRYYLSQMAEAGEKVTEYPLVHFLRNWQRLRRSPSPVFDLSYYTTVYTDVVNAGLNPLVHYLDHGRREGRRPSHHFDPSTYLALNPDVAQSGRDPFEHYVRYGRIEGRRTSYFSVRDLMLQEDSKPLRRPSARVDVIVPVYGGVAETRQCIDSVLASAASNETLGQIIVVDDHGPDPKMREYLAELGKDKRITLLDNEKNLGFVASVNRGMEFAAPNDVILLNSDTEVNGDWVDRLAAQAYQQSKIGSVTPFTNNGTICSYPAMPGSPRLPAGETTASLDNLFRDVNAGQSIDLPTAIGFCMYIKRACLEVNGLFDVEAFGRGYGEENDFCLRSAARGWRHILAGDVFVYHVGETSFGADSASNKQNAMRVLLGRYPDYLREVSRAASIDAPLRLRMAATAARFAQGNRPVVLQVLHGLGGGTAKHAEELALRFRDSVRYLFLRIEGNSLFTFFSADEDDGLNVIFRDDDPREVARLVRMFGVERVHVHHILGYEGDFQNFLRLIGVPYDITVHDYLLACPRVLLFRPDMKYCGEPDEVGCLSCLQEAPPGLSPDIIAWRWMGRQLMEGAERVICPSVDVATRMFRYASDANLFPAPHEDPAAFEHRVVSIPGLKPDEPMRIVVLGHIAGHKGGDFLLDCVAACQKAGVDVRFTVIGNLLAMTEETDAAIRSAIHVTGPYKSEDVGRLIAQADPHLIFYPQRSPETYSYTLSEGLLAGIPLLVPAIGAFPERVAGVDWCWIYELATPAGDVARLLGTIRKDHLETGRGPKPPAELPAPDGVKAQSGWFYDREFLSWTAQVDERRIPASVS